MTDPSTDAATVLVVEDERHLADLYAEYLADDYHVVTAYGGAEALDRLDDDVDVLVLDRRLPVRSGNEVLAAVDARSADPRVALVTSSDPEFDIVEMGADDYLVKPVTREDLRTVVERLVAVDAYTDALRDLTRKKLTRNVLRVEKRGENLCEHEEFRDLEADIDRLEDDLADLAGELDLEEANLRL